MSLLWFLFLGLLITVGDLTMAWSQQTPPYGVPVEPATSPTTPTIPGTQAPTAAVSQVERGSAGGALLRVTPLISMSERYDSNIVFLPDQVHDYVTNISPGALLEFRNDWIEATSLGSVISEIYARNPGLNYVGASETIYANLDNLAGRIIRGWTFRLSDAVVYTPQMPAFAAPQGGNQVAAEFVRGMQAYRNNTLSNSVSVQSGYAITPRVSINGSFSYSILRFLDDSNAQGSVSLLNTTSQNIMAGTEYRLSPTDTISISYLNQQFMFGSTTQGIGTSTGPSLSAATIQGGTVTWHSAPTPTLTIDLSPGMSVVEGSGAPQWTARAQLQWSVRPAVLSVSYTRGLFPSFVLDSGVLISDVVGASLMYNITDKWSISGDGSYADNRSVGAPSSVGSLTFKSKGYGVSVTHRFSPTMMITGSVIHSEFEYGVTGNVFEVARDAVTLQFRKEWR